MNRKTWLASFTIFVIATFSVYAAWNSGYRSGLRLGEEQGYGLGFGEGERRGYSKGLTEGVEEGYSQALQDLLDRLRELSPFAREAPIYSGLPNKVELMMFKSGATTVDVSLIEKGWHFLKKDETGIYYTQVKKNIVLNQGVERINKIFYDNVSIGTSNNATIIGWSSVQYTPAYTDTTCPNLITGSGLNPQRGTVTHGTASAGDMQTNITLTFTATATITATNMCLLYDTATETVVAAVDITDASLAADDTLTGTWIANTTN